MVVHNAFFEGFMGLSGCEIKVCGGILAGGQGKRLGGIAKGLIETASGESMIANIINQMHCCGVDDIVISANDGSAYERFGFDVVADLDGRIVGPLGGIEAVLNYYRGKCDAVVVMPCDLPNITSNEISDLIDRFISCPSPVVCARAADGNHPLCAVVGVKMLDKISEAIALGQRRIMGLWIDNDVSVVDFDSEFAFFNINTPADVGTRLLTI